MHKENTIQSSRLPNKIRTTLMATSSAVIMACACQISTAYAEDKQQTNIAQKELGAALLQIAQQRNANIIYNPELLQGKMASEVKGNFTTHEALHQILKNSGYKVELDKKGNFYIRKQSVHKTSSLNKDNPSTKKLAQNFTAIKSDAHAGQEQTRTPKSDLAQKQKKEGDTIEEIIVTGSHIRGVESASPIFIYDRADIEKTGLSTVPQFMRTLPQVFGGGASQGNIGLSSTNNAGLNAAGGSSINLRGLGTESTLVLLDGHRMAGAGFGSSFIDISMIPMAVLERVELLTDGASAIYGSDAVGGVVNFILRDNYDGAESRIRYGTVTEGSSDEVQVGQVFGKTWDGGHGLISYEFYRRNDLDSKDRSYTRDAIDPTTLLPEQTRHSVFVKAGQNITEQIKLIGTAFYGNREREQITSHQYFSILSPASNKQYGATVGLQSTLSDSWQGELLYTYNRNVSSILSQYFFAPYDPSVSAFLERDETITSKVTALDAKMDGTLLSMEGGNVKLAIGGQYRKESLDYQTGIFDSNRENYAAFGEIFIPLIGKKNSKPGFENLNVTVAARYEHYNDFGSSTDPKVGVLWSPLKDLNFRGTYGTSFRAPLLFELSDFNVASFLRSIPDPDDPSQNIPILSVSGNNANLQAETATTWTTGFDLKPTSVPGLNVSATYFTIKYKNRIGSPSGFVEEFANPIFSPFVTRNPDADLISFWTSQPNFTNLSSFDPADTTVFFDKRLTNMSTVDTKGLDFSISYDLENALGDWGFSLNSTYLFKQITQVTQTSAPYDIVDTVFNPAALKLNGGLSWSKDGFASNLNVNHIGSYKDDRTTPVVGVTSWTTFDLNLSYNTQDRADSPLLKDTIFSLSVQNVFDQDPPFVVGALGSSVNFDPDNATSLGRFIAFQITRKW